MPHTSQHISLGGRPSTRKFAHSPKLLKVQVFGPFAVDADSQSKIEIDLEDIFPMPFLDNFRVADHPGIIAFDSIHVSCTAFH
jgi:hypothetical protein